MINEASFKCLLEETIIWVFNNDPFLRVLKFKLNG